MSTELVETNANAAALVVTPSSIVRPAANIDEVLAVSAAYHELYSRLLDNNDFQAIDNKKFVKKSGWRKLALAFNVTTEIMVRDYERNEAGRIVRAEVVARASASNGRFADGLGGADLFEKCCMPSCHKRHTHCPAGNGGMCDGTRHWSHAQHDIPATAATRATNRACSDLFGMGEVSAEEVDAVRDTADAEAVYDAKARLDPWLKLATLTPEELAALRAWREESQMPAPSHMGMDEVEATLVRIGMLMGAREALKIAQEAVERAAPRAATPAEGTATETPQDFDERAQVELSNNLFGSTDERTDMQGDNATEVSWAEKDFEERTRPDPGPKDPGTPNGPSTPSSTDQLTTSTPAPATSEPLVTRGRAMHFHRKAGAMFSKEKQEAVIQVASQGRTTHAGKLTESEMTMAETLLEQLVQGHQQVDRVMAAAQELAEQNGGGDVRS